jgi:hypothetical protein
VPDGNSLPWELFDKAHEAEMEEFLKKFNKFIIEYPTYDTTYKELYKQQIALHYFFKTLDFLLQNEFISHLQYRSTFQNCQIMDVVILFASKLHPEDISNDVTTYTYDLDELTETYKPEARYFSGNS